MATRREIRVGIPESGFRALAKIVKNVDKLRQIMELTVQLSKGEDQSLRCITREIAAQTGLGDADVREMLDGLSALHYLASELGSPSEEFLRILRDNVKRQARPPWADLILDRWNDAVPELAAVLGEQAVAPVLELFRKAQELQYAHQNILTDVRIVTDIRPIFNRTGDAIIEAILSHVLLVDFVDGESSVKRRLELAMDDNDVSSLRNACERAEIKSAFVKKCHDALPWALHVPDSD